MTWLWSLLGCIAACASSALVGYFLGYNKGIKHGMLLASNALDALAARVKKDVAFGPYDVRSLIVTTLDEAAKALRRT